MERKKHLRDKYKMLRKSLSPQDRDTMSVEIANKLLALPIWNFSFYHIFLPIERFREIDTQYILSILGGKDKNAIVSKSDFEKGTMSHYLLQDSTQISISQQGIPEPRSGIKISPESIDVVFVPLLAYDREGNRIGYGKGFYDRFLAECTPEVIKIGLSYFDPIDGKIASSSTDVKLDYCVTPKNSYKF